MCCHRFLLALVLLTAAGTAPAHDPSAWGGMFRSRDDGATWQPTDAGLFIGGAMALAISPGDPNHLLYATDTRLLRSRNGGRDWAHEAAGKLIGPTLSVAFDQAGKGAVASSSAGVFRTDDGSQWEAVSAPSGAAPARVIAAGAAEGSYYLAGPGGVFASQDHGRSFVRAGPGLPDATPNALVVTTRPQEQLLVVVSGGLWRSIDGGSTWEPLRNGLPDGRVDAASADSASPAHLWAFASNQLFERRTEDDAWRPVGTRLPDPVISVRGLAVSADGQAIVLTTHRGLMRSADGGGTWSTVEGVLPTHLESGPLLRDPHDRTTLYAGFALTPYAEIFRRAENGNNLLSQLDPVSLAGGLAFLILLVIGGLWIARRLARRDPPLLREPRP